jgi:hypothetical protein
MVTLYCISYAEANGVSALSTFRVTSWKVFLILELRSSVPNVLKRLVRPRDVPMEESTFPFRAESGGRGARAPLP